MNFTITIIHLRFEYDTPIRYAYTCLANFWSLFATGPISGIYFRNTYYSVNIFQLSCYEMLCYKLDNTLLRFFETVTLDLFHMCKATP